MVNNSNTFGVFGAGRGTHSDDDVPTTASPADGSAQVFDFEDPDLGSAPVGTSVLFTAGPNEIVGRWVSSLDAPVPQSSTRSPVRIPADTTVPWRRGGRYFVYQALDGPSTLRATDVFRYPE